MTLPQYFSCYIYLSFLLCIPSLSYGTPIESNSYMANDTTTIKLIDHHTHIYSEQAKKYLINAVDGLDSLPPLGPKQLLNVMSDAQVNKAALLSTAYFFSSEGKTNKNKYRALKSDNTWIANVVTKHPDKFVGFFSVNPLSDSASTVIKRNAQIKAFSGLKLHLANSKVDLRNPKHVQKIGKIFQQANANGLGVIVHMRYKKQPYGKKDAKIFVDKILSKAPDVPIQIGHLAGWGGYDRQTDEALSIFADYSANNKLNTNIYFDLSAVIRPVRNQEDSTQSYQPPKWYPQKRYERLTQQIKKVGLDRILFGTDWPDWNPRSYKNDIVNKLNLSKNELDIIFSNKAPWFQ